jgi:nitroreductase
VNTIDTIHARQSQGSVLQTPIGRQDIETLLDAAVQAPNHYTVRPWRFVVLTGDGRNRLGEIMAGVLRRKFPEADEKALEKERNKPLRAPLLIAVGVDPPEDSRVIEIENVCAAAAACQNLLLAATEMGLAGQWRTGEAAREPEIKAFLGLAPAQQLIAFLYLGRPTGQAAMKVRPSFDDRTTWMD